MIEVPVISHQFLDHNISMVRWRAGSRWARWALDAGFPGRREVRNGDGDGVAARRVQLVGTGDLAACGALIQARLRARAGAQPPAASLRLSASLREHTRWVGLSLLYHLTHFLAVTGDALPSFPNPSLQQVSSPSLSSLRDTVEVQDGETRSP